MERRISHSIMVDADPATVFDVLADPSQHSLFDGSDTVRGSTSGPPRLYLGARFSMRMRWGAPYVISNTVCEYEEDRLIAWRHVGRHVWRYELRAVGTGADTKTEVTETFDWSPAPLGFTYERLGFIRRNNEAIKTTLQQLKVLVESRVVTAR